MLTVIGESAKQTKAVNQYDELCEKARNVLRERNANKDYITTSKLKNVYSGKVGRFGVSDKIFKVLKKQLMRAFLFKQPAEASRRRKAHVLYERSSITAKTGLIRAQKEAPFSSPKSSKSVFL